MNAKFLLFLKQISPSTDMCGRYSFVPTKKQLDEQLNDVELPKPLQLRYNIAPTQQAYVMTSERPRVLQSMAWGLVPYWSKDGVNHGKLINARSESILEKPSFRIPAQERHCLVPADSFYEWQNLPGKRKVPYRIRLKNQELMFMAGIWDEWKQGGYYLRSFSIVTTTPNADLAALHNRMPVLLLCPEKQKLWLETTNTTTILQILAPPKNQVLEYYRVTERLNSAGYEGNDAHNPIDENLPPTLF